VASKEFLKMLVSIAIAALAVVHGGQMGGAGAATGVLIGPGTGSAGVAGNAMMEADKDGQSGGKDDLRPEPQGNAKATRESRVQELAKDPAHGGAVRDKTLREAEVGVELEEAGKLPKPITRDPSGAAEFIDGMNQPWDVKRFNSNFPARRGGIPFKIHFKRSRRSSKRARTSSSTRSI
jgi:hypothetical protein